jgi:hypothetical protein
MLIPQEVAALEEPVASKNQLSPGPGLQQGRVIAGSQSEVSMALKTQCLGDLSDQPVFSSFHLPSSQEIPVATRTQRERIVYRQNLFRPVL